MDKGKTNFLSVVIITKNERENVASCIESVLPIADDILIVDSFSTDDTPEICAAYPLRFVQREWEGYARTKNWANSQAAHDWILSMDADEALSPELQQSIAQLKKEDHTYFYKFSRLSSYCGRWIKHGGWYPDIKVRLFDRRRARWTGDYVHERLEVDEGVEIKMLKGDCYHYTFTSIEQHAAQVNRYSSLAAQEKFELRKKASFGKVVFSPLFSFISIYIFKEGFLDGRNGFIIAVISAYARFLRYAKLYQMQRGSKKI